VDDITGIFINTLPVTVAVDEHTSAAEWLRSLQAAQAESRRFEHVPLTRMQAWSGVGGGRNLFDSIVVFENYPISEDGLGLRDLQALETTNYPISLVAVPGKRLSLGLGYDPELFDLDTVERLGTHLAQILETIAADPEIPLGRIEMLTEHEREHILVDLNDTDHEVTAATLTDLVRAQTARTPDAVAVISDAGQLTFAELDARANRLARTLIARGAGPERIVALVLPRSVEIIVAQLAVLKTGAAYLPVDPEYPAERIAFMLDDSEPVLVVTEHDMLMLDDESDAPVQRPVLPDNPAYVIYTSGSTGRPKAVVVTHAGMASFSAAEVARFDVRPRDRVLQFSSPSFDASVLELCMSLPVGAALVVPPPGPLLGEHLARVLADKAVTHALIPPVAMATVAEVNCRPSGHSSSVATPAPPNLWHGGRRAAR